MNGVEWLFENNQKKGRLTMCDNMLGKGTSRETGELLKGIIERLLGTEGAYWARVYNKAHRKENPFEAGIDVNPYRKDVKSWEKFYAKVFDETHDFSSIRIPEKPKGDWWLIILAKGMTPERLFQKCRQKFGAWKWTDRNLDEIVISDRTAKDGHYAVWVRARAEADEEFKNLSTNQLKEQKHAGITLEERLALELFYFWKTKKHLDIQNWTLCTGSRGGDGFVPCVNWRSGRGGLRVGWDFPGRAGGGLRSRQAVS